MNQHKTSKCETTFINIKGSLDLFFSLCLLTYLYNILKLVYEDRGIEAMMITYISNTFYSVVFVDTQVKRYVEDPLYLHLPTSYKVTNNPLLFPKHLSTTIPPITRVLHPSSSQF